LTPPPTVLYWPDAGVGGGSWDPSQLSSLVAWYDVSAETGYSNGDTINSLTDQSGNGITVNGTGTYNTNVQNGLPVVTQSGNFFVSSTVTNFNGHTRAILIIVVKDASSGCLSIDGSSSTSRLILKDFGSSYQVLLTMTSPHPTASAGVNPTGFNLAAALADDYSGNNSYARPVARINGTEYTGGSDSSHVGFLSGGHKVILANSPAGQQVCEAVLVSDDVSYEWTNDEPEKLEGYLAHKWGLTGKLPLSHPYKNAAP